MEGTMLVRARGMVGGVRHDRASLQGPCQGPCGLGMPPGEAHRGPVTRVWGGVPWASQVAPEVTNPPPTAGDERCV